MSKYYKKNVPSIMEMVVPEKMQIVPEHEFNVHNIAEQSMFTQWLAEQPELEYITVKAGCNTEKVATIPTCFDVESTTINDGNEHRAYIYIWQFQFGNVTIIGRKPYEFMWTLAQIQKRYPELGTVNVGKKRRVTHMILIGIANLTFEFQFISKWEATDEYHNAKVDFVSSVFADGVHSPITCGLTTSLTQQDAFKVIDILRVGSVSLESTAKDYCITQKLVGDLEYKLLRNSETELTEQEMNYCRNDVIVGAEYMQYYIDGYVRQCHLVPITKTGLVRAAIAHEFFKDGHTTSELAELFPETFGDYYNVMRYLYRGGQTGTAANKVDEVWENVEARDYTSDYPACIVQELFPVTKFRLIKTPRIERLDEYANKHNKCWYATFKFKHIRRKTNVAVESMSKCFEYEYVKEHMSEIKDAHPEWRKLTTPQQVMRRLYDMIDDNNKVAFAGQMTVMLTEQDWETYRNFYSWDDVEITEFHVARRGRLPHYITSVVEYYYVKKSILKKAGLEDSIEYKVAKAMLNSIYGLMVQKMRFDNYKFSRMHGWMSDKPSVTNYEDFARMREEYRDHARLGEHGTNKYGTEREPEFFMSPMWGVWVTAHARRRIMGVVKELGDDFLYMDTDSVYFTNAAKHQKLFDDWNKNIRKLNQSLFGEKYDDMGDLGTFDPVAIKGKDENGNKVKSTVFSFKTWGSKRYVKIDVHGNMEQTIAGLPKGVIMDTIKAHKDELGYGDLTDKELAFKAFEFFKPGMQISLADSNKLTTRYNDHYHTDMVTDYQGHTEMMISESSVALYDIPFVMTVDDYYMGVVEAIKAGARF